MAVGEVHWRNGQPAHASPSVGEMAAAVLPVRTSRLGRKRSSAGNVRSLTAGSTARTYPRPTCGTRHRGGTVRRTQRRSLIRSTSARSTETTVPSGGSLARTDKQPAFVDRLTPGPRYSIASGRIFSAPPAVHLMSGLNAQVFPDVANHVVRNDICSDGRLPTRTRVPRSELENECRKKLRGTACYRSATCNGHRLRRQLAKTPVAAYSVPRPGWPPGE